LSRACVASFSSLRAAWQTLLPTCPVDTIFLTWEWQDLWWRLAGAGELHLVTVQVGDQLVGIAPLTRHGNRWGFAGGVEVADYLDVIAHPLHATDVAVALLDYLQARGGSVELRNLRPGSFGATVLFEEARRRGWSPRLEPEDVSPRIALPADWETYLQSLTKKDRHELRRKLRRLTASGNTRYAPILAPWTQLADVDAFLRLHRASAVEKAAFMTPTMERFFRGLVDEFGPRGWLRLYFLEVDGTRVASAILFDYGGEFLLYNSGYDPAYAHLSVGLLLKALCLRDAIGEGRRAFDFLQGGESYKYDLGGTDVPIFRLSIDVAGHGWAERAGDDL
jgi:CelD/BcsL family acetyltransferase involved in cellulose biosynthesis